MIAEVELSEEPEWGVRRDDKGIHGFNRLEDGQRVRVVVSQQPAERTREPTLLDLSEALTDTYHAERHPVAARVLRITMAMTALNRGDERTEALRDTMSELLSMDEPRKRLAAIVSGLDIHYDLGDGHPLLGRRMPDLDLVTADGPLRVFTLLHRARPVLLDLGEPGGYDIAPWADRVTLVDAEVAGGAWELPVSGAVAAPTAVLVRPDGHVAWVGDGTDLGLADALTTWFGPPTAA